MYQIEIKSQIFLCMILCCSLSLILKLVRSRASSYHTHNTLKLTAEDLDQITNHAVDTPEPIRELPSDPPNVEEREEIMVSEEAKEPEV